MSDDFILEDFEDEDPNDVCDHGVGFDCNCAGCDNDPIGCVFPGKCLMVGVHCESECHTVEMMEEFERQIRGKAMSSLILDAPITELTLVRWRTFSDSEAARLLDARLRALEDMYKRSFVERGVILLEMQERGLWRFVGDCHSFEDWVVKAAPHSRSDCFAAMRAVKELRDIPRSELESMPRCNIALLQTLSSSVRSRGDVIQAAQTLSEKDFRDQIMTNCPEQHIESMVTLPRLRYPAGDAATVLRVLGKVGERLGVDDFAGQLLALCIDVEQESE